MTDCSDSKPNIIFILADDMGYGDLGCFGATQIPTPHCDRLASEGMRFVDAHSSSAVCTPSRYSVVTGRYCWRTRLKSGVLGGFSSPLIDRNRLTVAQLLKQNGYATACIGKWHLGWGWQPQDGVSLDDDDSFEAWGNEGGLNVDYTKPLTDCPTDHGFDYSFCIAGSLDMAPYCFIENNHTVGTPDREKDPYHNQQRKGLMTPGWKDEECDITFARKATEFSTTTPVNRSSCTFPRPHHTAHAISNRTSSKAPRKPVTAETWWPCWTGWSGRSLTRWTETESPTTRC